MAQLIKSLLLRIIRFDKNESNNSNYLQTSQTILINRIC